MSYNSPKNQGNPNQNKGSQYPSPDPKSVGFNSEWIEKGITPQTIKFAEDYGKELADKKLTTSQIRNVFGEIRRIEARMLATGQTTDEKIFQSEEASFLLLRPKMAYAAGRVKEKGEKAAEGILIFKDILEQAHRAVASGEPNTRLQRFNRFVQLMEAILAYHKASGGKEQ